MKELTLEAVEEIRDWIKEEIESAVLIEKAKRKSGNEDEANYFAGVRLGFAYSRGYIKQGGNLDLLIRCLVADVEAEKDMPRYRRFFAAKEGVINGYGEVIGYLKALRNKSD